MASEPDRAAAPPVIAPLGSPRRAGAGAAPDLVPARMLNEAIYCERRLYLEWVQCEFEDNEYTVEGRAVHRRADRPRPLKKAEPRAAEARGTEGGTEAEDESAEGEGEPAQPPPPYTARSVWLSSERLGITAKLDVVDVDGGSVVPIEYKRGKRPDVPEGAYLPERVQLCSHVLLLRDHGFRCEEAHIYFAGDRQRVPIAIDDTLIEATLGAVARAREIVEAGVIPPPLSHSPKCDGCSLVGICLPDEVNLLRDGRQSAPPAPPAAPTVMEQLDQHDVEELGDDPWGLGPAREEGSEAEEQQERELRRLHPARDDRVPLYVQEQGAYVGLSGERLEVRRKQGVLAEARLSNTSQVCLLGNIQISTQALRELLERGIPVTFFSRGGWYIGRAIALDSRNVELRMAQHRAAADPALCLRLARGFVRAKILNCRTLLRRNARPVNHVALGELTQLARKATEAAELGSLLGLEGTAARTYFREFNAMLTERARVAEELLLSGRNRRPPRDPVNAMLSYVYSLLAKDVSLAVVAAGLDPLLGFYHQPRFGRPALALDLMEELRPIVADSVVITAVNNEVLTRRDFIEAAGGVSMTQTGRRDLTLAYERRMDQLVTHPVFGYRISYRRVLEVQARLLGRMLTGEIEAYPSFRTR